MTRSQLNDGIRRIIDGIDSRRFTCREAELLLCFLIDDFESGVICQGEREAADE